MCNTNSWHFNSHFGWYFISSFLSLSRNTKNLFNRTFNDTVFHPKKLPVPRQFLLFFFVIKSPLCLFLSSHSPKLHRKNYYYYFIFFFHCLWWLKLFMEQLCEKISLADRKANGRILLFLGPWLRDTVNGPKRFPSYSWRFRGT